VNSNSKRSLNPTTDNNNQEDQNPSISAQQMMWLNRMIGRAGLPSRRPGSNAFALDLTNMG